MVQIVHASQKIMIPLFVAMSLGLIGNIAISQTMVASFPHLCTGGAFPTGVFYDENTCEIHLHCSNGGNYRIDSVGTVTSTYAPYPSSHFSHTDMERSPSGNLYQVRDISPIIYGPGAELWEINLGDLSSMMVMDLTGIVTWEPWGFAIHPGNGNYLFGEVRDTLGIRTQFITEYTTTGTFVDTILTISQMDSLGINAGSGGLAIDPISGNLIIGGWFGAAVGKLFAVNLASGNLSLFFDAGFTGFEGATGLAFTPSGDFVISTFAGVFFYDRNGDNVFECLNSVLGQSDMRLTASYEDKQGILRWQPHPNWQEYALQHSFDGIEWKVYDYFTHSSFPPNTIIIADLASGKHFFRLKIQSANGDQFLSNVAELTVPEILTTIFPNPATDILTVTVQGRSSKEILIRDIQGKNMMYRKFSPGSSEWEIGDLLSPGWYLLHIPGQPSQKLLKH